VFWVGRDGDQGLGGGFEQEVIDDRLVVIGDVRDRSRQGEDDMEIGHWQEFGLAVGQPFLGKPDARLIKLLIRARRFNTALVGSDSLPFAALAKREGVSPSYFTRLVRLSYLAPDIAQAILDGRQPRVLTANNLLAHSRLPLAWHRQRAVLGFA
jgi:hypothetical protein